MRELLKTAWRNWRLYYAVVVALAAISLTLLLLAR